MALFVNTRIKWLEESITTIDNRRQPYLARKLEVVAKTMAAKLQLSEARDKEDQSAISRLEAELSTLQLTLQEIDHRLGHFSNAIARRERKLIKLQPDSAQNASPFRTPQRSR